MITVAEHTYEEKLLPEKAKVLDLGCRGFLFFKELDRLGHRVVCVDCDDLSQPPTYYHNIAITNYNGFTDVYKSNDPQATRINFRHDQQSHTSVQCLTIKAFSDALKIPFWDLIKIDIEGSEYEVIMSLTEPPAKQLSIEFHLHTKIYGEAQVKEMEDKLVSLGYYPAKHDKTSEHGCGQNYWDSLWVLK